VTVSFSQQDKDRCPQIQYRVRFRRSRRSPWRREEETVASANLFTIATSLVKALAITSISDTVTFCKEDDSVQSKFSLSFPIGNKGSKVICTLYPCNVV
jgi:hypothetical protein